MPVAHPLSSAEQALATSLIKRASVAARIYDGDYRAPWLLSTSIFCEVWSLKKSGGETRVVNGQTIGDRKFDWRVRLPNGGLLTDKKHAALLQGMQKLAFLARATSEGPDTLTTHLNFLWTLTFLARWMFHREAALEPSAHCFSRLTHDHFCDLIRELAAGGVPFALQLPQQLLRIVYPLALGREPNAAELTTPFALGAEDCLKVRGWLQREGHLKKQKRCLHGDHPEVPNLKAIADMLWTDVHTITNPKFSAFLTQFTVGPLEINNAVLRASSDSRREFASHRAKIASELAEMPASEKTVGKYLGDLRTLVMLHRHLPAVCPEPGELRMRQLNSLVVCSCRPREATPWVPLKTALEYTKESLRWIHVYGQPLVDLFLSAYAKLFDAGLLDAPPTGTDVEKSTAYRAITAARDAALSTVKIPKVLAPLNIQGWQAYVHLDGDLGFKKLRDQPSMLDAIMVLIASIAIITAAMKPMRESELRHLRRDCIFFVKRDGYWLSARQGKRSVADVAPDLRRPIPSIVAKGILLLQQLTDGLKQITGVKDQWLLDSLFAMPTLSRYEAKVDAVISAEQLNQLLDTFCDRIALPPDSNGRRWYIRVHEMRKSFLIVFFWTYRYANLEAAAWMAGHIDVAQLYAYLQANFPGEELPGIEAEYASKVLRAHSDGSEYEEVENVDLLYETVCRNFGVRDISWIDERALQSWLTARFAGGDFEIRPYSVPVPGGHAEIHIAFRIRESE